MCVVVTPQNTARATMHNPQRTHRSREHSIQHRAHLFSVTTRAFASPQRSPPLVLLTRPTAQGAPQRASTWFPRAKRVVAKLRNAQFAAGSQPSCVAVWGGLGLSFATFCVCSLASRKNLCVVV